MFRHIVLLRLADDAPEGRAGEIVEALRRLPATVTTLRRYDVGLDQGLAAGNAHVGVVADFDDRAGYEAYRDHPDHVAVIAGLITPVLAERTAVQVVLDGDG